MNTQISNKTNSVPWIGSVVILRFRKQIATGQTKYHQGGREGGDNGDYINQ